MNPYYPNPNQYQYQNQPIQYGYAQGPYLGYQSQNQAPNFSVMYTSVQPYNSKQFLLSTFGNRPDFINVFQTLPHEDKLMLYVCTEQKRMYGQIKNKQSYQRLLKDIAQKVQNYNNFHNSKKEPQTKEDQKIKELQNKIDDIVERTFEKLNLSNLAHNHSQHQKESKHEEVFLTEQDEDQEWVEPEEGPAQPQPLSPAKSQPQKQPLTAPIFNMFTFDSQFQQALTQQIGLKPAVEKKSIWQLDLAEEQVMMSQPNLKQIFKSKSPQVSAANQISQEKENLYFSHVAYKSENQPWNLSHPLYSQKSIITKPEQAVSQEKAQLFSLNGGRENLQGLWQSQPKSSHIDKDSTQQSNYGNYGISRQYQSTQQQSQQISRQQSGFILDNTPEIPRINGIAIMETRTCQPQQNQVIHNDEKQQFVEALIQKQASQVQHQIGEKGGKKQQSLAGQLILPQSQQTVNSQHNHQFDFDLLTGFSPTPLQQVAQMIETGLTDTSAPSNGQPDSSVFEMNDLILQVSEPPQNKFVVSGMLSPRRMQLLPFKVQSQDYSLLKGLKVELDLKKKQMIQKKLQNKSFECETQFYLTMMSHLQQISLRYSTQYQHFKQQYLIVQELHEETRKYTTAVDEDEEETVASSIKRTKDLYRQIYAHSQQTELYTNRILSPENQEKGLLYKFGKVLIDSCISQDILSKVIANQARDQIEQSFYVLYALQKCNALNSLKPNAQKIIAYANTAYQKYRSFDSQIIEEVEQRIDKYPQYVQYVKGIVRILEICERMIILLKATYIKPQANVVKTLKNCKDIRTKYHKYRGLSHLQVLLPENYKQTVKEGIQKNKSLYDLHAAFSEIYQKNPVCRICLMEVCQHGAKTSENYCHYSCFNLLAEINRQEQYKQDDNMY